MGEGEVKICGRSIEVEEGFKWIRNRLDVIIVMEMRILINTIVLKITMNLYANLNVLIAIIVLFYYVLRVQIYLVIKGYFIQYQSNNNLLRKLPKGRKY